jgi:hypothetical protein
MSLFFHDHVLQACGSGATTGGLALANHLSGYGAKVIGYGVCDSEDYFYDFIDGLFKSLGSDVKARDVLSIHNAKGAGYAISRWKLPLNCSLACFSSQVCSSWQPCLICPEPACCCRCTDGKMCFAGCRKPAYLVRMLGAVSHH